jgi:decaprenylphospho-beta-D-erythro-pentofuranosid-2-ulose 2-reductase
MSGTVLILGATSDMARALARGFAAKGYAVQLAARDPDQVIADKADLETRYGMAVSLHRFDALEIDHHAAFVAGLSVLPDVAVCAVGLMGDQDENAADMGRAVQVMRSNFEGPATIFGVLANAMEARGSGILIGISSVAGERGRATNYIYGSAKAGFTAYLSGLRNRLAGRGVHIITVLPGFVATKMTEGMDLPKPLLAQPEEIATATLKAIAKGRNIIYVRPIWWGIMAIIKAIPERIFKTLSI